MVHFEGNDDYSHVPSWKKWISALVLILTVVAMIFEKQLGVKLYVKCLGWCSCVGGY